jgi:hypothetical protein
MILIVGAGLSGLFTACNLYVKGIKFIILEKDSIGGKIKSLNYKNSIIECGPSVINDNQDNLITLCKQLGIKLKYTSSNFYSYNNLVDPKNLSYDKGQVKDILSKGDTSTFDESQYMLYNDWLKSVRNEGKYMYIDGGFEKLISTLYNKLKKYIFKGELIKVYNRQTDTLPVTVDIKSNNNIKTSSFYKIIFCTTMTQLYNINFEKPLFVPYNHYTKRMESLRVYVILNTEASTLNDVFKNYNVIYNKDFGLTIKISEYIILLVYTDGKHALEMNNKEKINTTAKFYNLDKNIKEVKTFFYKDAFDAIVSQENLSFKLEDRIFQSAFPDRYNQAWVEGNLIQCKKIIDCIV